MTYDLYGIKELLCYTYMNYITSKDLRMASINPKVSNRPLMSIIFVTFLNEICDYFYVQCRLK